MVVVVVDRFRSDNGTRVTVGRRRCNTEHGFGCNGHHGSNRKGEYGGVIVLTWVLYLFGGGCLTLELLLGR